MLFVEPNISPEYVDVRIHTYFLNNKWVRGEESLGNIAISNLSVLSIRVQPTVRDLVLLPQMLGKDT